MHSESGGPAISDPEHLSCNVFNGLVDACGEAAWGEGKAVVVAELVCANGITKSPPVRPQMPTLYFMHFKAMFFALLLSFQLFIYFSGKCRMWSMTGWLRRVERVGVC